MNRTDIHNAIDAERERQDRIHGPTLDIQRIPAVLGEEFGEVCEAINDHAHRDRLREELIQCAAVCVKAIDSMDRMGMRVVTVDPSKIPPEDSWYTYVTVADDEA